MKDIELPPMPTPDHYAKVSIAGDFIEAGASEEGNYSFYSAEDMQSYARAAVEADRAQRVPHQVYLSGRTLIDAARRDWPSTATHRARVLEAASALESALLASTPAPAQQEPSEAEMVCAEAYQVVGCLLSDLGMFETEAARKILDNLSEARMVHQDVLPWESAAQHQEPPQQPVERKPSAEQVLEKVLAIVRGYLPPDGMLASAAMSEIIALVDPWPLGDPKGPK